MQWRRSAVPSLLGCWIAFGLGCAHPRELAPDASEPQAPAREAETSRTSPAGCDAGAEDLERELCHSSEALSAGNLDSAVRYLDRAIVGSEQLRPGDPRVAQLEALIRGIVQGFADRRQVPAAAEFLAEARREAERIGGEQHVLVPYLLFELAMQLDTMADEVGAELAARQAAERSTALLGESDPLSVQSSILRGRILLGAGRVDEAAAIAEHALNASHQTSTTESPDVLDASLLLAQVRQSQGRSEEALALLDSVDATSRGLYGDSFIGRSTGLAIKARLLHLDYRHEEAIETARRVVSLFETNQQPPDRRLSAAYHTLADAASSLGWNQQAYAWAKASLEALRALPAKGTDEVMKSLEQLAITAARADRTYEAESYLLRAMALARRMNALNDSRTALYYALGAEIAARQHRDDQAENTFVQAVSLSHGGSSPDPRVARDVMIRYASFRSDRGRWQEAAAMIEEVDRLPEPPDGSRGPLYVRGLYLRALVSQRLGRLDEADRHYRAAIEGAEKALGTRSLLLIPIYRSYSQLLAQTGHATRARQLSAKVTALRDRATGSPEAAAVPARSPQRHEFAPFHFAYELPPAWQEFDPRAMRLGGLIGFAREDLGVMATINATSLSDRTPRTNEALAERVVELMKVLVGDFRLVDRSDRTVAGIEGKEIRLTGTRHGKGYRYRIWVAVHGDSTYQLQMWSVRDHPPFPGPWAEFLAGFRPTP